MESRWILHSVSKSKIYKTRYFVVHVELLCIATRRETAFAFIVAFFFLFRKKIHLTKNKRFNKSRGKSRENNKNSFSYTSRSKCNFCFLLLLLLFLNVIKSRDSVKRNYFNTTKIQWKVFWCHRSIITLNKINMICSPDKYA